MSESGTGRASRHRCEPRGLLSDALRVVLDLIQLRVVDLSLRAEPKLELERLADVPVVLHVLFHLLKPCVALLQLLLVALLLHQQHLGLLVQQLDLLPRLPQLRLCLAKRTNLYKCLHERH